jgi:hypothetical protein
MKGMHITSKTRLLTAPRLVLIGLVAMLALGASVAAAQAPPAPPARFLGTVMVNGAPAAAGTTVTAMVGTATCGQTTVFASGGDERYTIDVPALDATLAPGCGTDAAPVSFIVGGTKANETGSWRSFQLNQLNLTVGGAAATATATATKVATPVAPVTGSGVTDSGGAGTTTLMLVAGMLVVVSLGAGGLALAKRTYR